MIERATPDGVARLQFSVAKLVHHNAVDHIIQQHQQTVEIQVPLTGTAAPAGTLIANGDASIIYPHKRGIVSDLFRDHNKRLLGQCSKFFRCVWSLLVT